MSGQGFGKVKTLPVAGKGKKTKGKLENYTLCHLGADGVVRTLEVKAESQRQAFRKFNSFLDILDLCYVGASDEEILDFIKKNPIDGVKHEPYVYKSLQSLRHLWRYQEQVPTGQRR
jgi:hypothetical protein